MVNKMGRCDGVKECKLKSCEHHPMHTITKECKNCCDWQYYWDDHRSCVEYVPITRRGTKK